MRGSHPGIRVLLSDMWAIAVLPVTTSEHPQTRPACPSDVSPEHRDPQTRRAGPSDVAVYAVRRSAGYCGGLGSPTRRFRGVRLPNRAGQPPTAPRPASNHRGGSADRPRLRRQQPKPVSPKPRSPLAADLAIPPSQRLAQPHLFRSAGRSDEQPPPNVPGRIRAHRHHGRRTRTHTSSRRAPNGDRRMEVPRWTAAPRSRCWVFGGAPGVELGSRTTRKRPVGLPSSRLPFTRPRVGEQDRPGPRTVPVHLACRNYGTSPRAATARLLAAPSALPRRAEEPDPPGCAHPPPNMVNHFAECWWGRIRGERAGGGVG